MLSLCSSHIAIASDAGDVVCKLLGCEGTRLYHDNCLSRAPGSKHTRWHCDDGPGRYMAMQPCPRLGQRAVTVWYPLQGATGPEKGSLIFASLPTHPRPSSPADSDTDTDTDNATAAGVDTGEEREHRCISAFDVAAEDGCPVSEQSDEYDAFVSTVLEKRGCTLSTATYELGDVSVHYTDCFHTAGPNWTSSPRMIMGVTYFADGTVMRTPSTDSSSSTHEGGTEDSPPLPLPPPPALSSANPYKKFCPGCEEGDVIATKLNPLLPHCPE